MSNDLHFQAFIAVISLLALASADQTHQQSFKLGNAPTVTTTISKAHGSRIAAVHSQPSAQPSEVGQYHNEEKYQQGNLAPVPHYANRPVHGAAYHPIPAPYHPHVVHAPAYHAPAPVYHAAPVVHAPAHHATAPVYVPAYHAPAPAYKPVVHAPAYHAPAPAHHASTPAYHGKEPEYDTPAVYQYGYAVQDDYSGANFASDESRDGYATRGSYRVALPDGRTQIVNYNVADAYSGYVADVTYEGQANYSEYKPTYKAAAPAYHA
jgi:hypothetical protein